MTWIDRSIAAAGSWRNAWVFPSAPTPVWPEFVPPTRTAAATVGSRRTISRATLPLPSDPNWPPTTTETGIRDYSFEGGPSAPAGQLWQIDQLSRHSQ